MRGVRIPKPTAPVRVFAVIQVRCFPRAGRDHTDHRDHTEPPTPDITGPTTAPRHSQHDCPPTRKLSNTMVAGRLQAVGRQETLRGGKRKI